MRKNFANSTSSHWNADASELTSSWPSRFSKVKLTLSRLTSSPAHPEVGYLQITARTRPRTNQRSCKPANVAGNIANADDTEMIIHWSYWAHALWASTHFGTAVDFDHLIILIWGHWDITWGCYQDKPMRYTFTIVNLKAVWSASCCCVVEPPHPFN